MSLEEELLEVASRVVENASRRGVRLVTAESVTGGMVGAALTGISGASEVYGGGIVSYGEGAKVGLLGVSRSALAREGAVSAVVARAMLRGVLSHGEAVWGEGRLLGVAVTGWAEGRAVREEEEKVGLVFIGVGFAKGEAEIQEHRLDEHERAAVRGRTTKLALEALEQQLRE